MMPDTLTHTHTHTHTPARIFEFNSHTFSYSYAWLPWLPTPPSGCSVDVCGISGSSTFQDIEAN